MACEKFEDADVVIISIVTIYKICKKWNRLAAIIGRYSRKSKGTTTTFCSYVILTA